MKLPLLTEKKKGKGDKVLFCVLNRVLIISQYVTFHISYCDIIKVLFSSIVSSCVCYLHTKLWFSAVLVNLMVCSHFQLTLMGFPSLQ